MKGTVTEWFWANPHCFLQFDVKDDSGNRRALGGGDQQSARHD